MIAGFTPRRIVTGHDDDGMSYVTSDSCATCHRPLQLLSCNVKFASGDNVCWLRGSPQRCAAAHSVAACATKT